jgi:hypothetical protein
MAAVSTAPSSFETGSIQEKLASSEPRYSAVKLSNPQQHPLDFDTDDADNPRKWTQKKKIALASFVLLSAFVA